MHWLRKLLSGSEKTGEKAGASDETKVTREPTSLDDLIPIVKAALSELPVSDEQRLRGQIQWIADRWRVGSSRILEGDANRTESALLECFGQDLKGETFYFDMNADTDGWSGVAHNVYFRCGRGMHHVGRYGDQQYIAVFHRRF
jgi:hypothetical protein